MLTYVWFGNALSSRLCFPFTRLMAIGQHLGMSIDGLMYALEMLFNRLCFPFTRLMANIWGLCIDGFMFGLEIPL